MKWLAILVALGGIAAANGRAESTQSITFRPGHETDIWVGLTFGAIASHDGGATWYWTCEDAIGFAGEWDPDYLYTASGKLFATTHHGLRVQADGCTFGPTALGGKFATSEELAPNGDIFVGLADPTDGAIHRSVDDGATFPSGVDPGMIGDTWQSLAIAPSDPMRVYAAGFRYIPDPTGHAGNVRAYTLFRSVDAGASFQAMSQDGVAAPTSMSVLEIAGVSRTEPDVVFLRAANVGTTGVDLLYRSVDGGASPWAQVLAPNTTIPSFVMRANGDAVAGTPNAGTLVAHDCGSTGACTGWTALAGAPHTNCLVENSAGELWACTQNFGTPKLPSDGAGIMKTTDLATWTPVLRYQDIAGPIACGEGSVQTVACTRCTGVEGDAGATSCWCGVRTQIGITADPTSCPVMNPEQLAKPPSHGGCCDAGEPPASAVLVGILVFRRRRTAR